MENYKYYIVPDLMTWARPMSGLKQTPIEYYETIDAAAARFKELRAQPYNDEVTLNENNGEPYTRLCLGIERTDAPSAIDILHVRNGVHYLVDDYRRVASMKDDPAVLNCLRDVSGTIGFDRVRPYVKRKDERGTERLVPGKDSHISEWMPFYEFGKAQHFIRFPCIGKGDLFKLRDGQSIVLTHADGTEHTQSCIWNGDAHVRIGYRTWHINEFAENRFRNGYMIAPEHPQPGDRLDSYEIYQAKEHTPYLFEDYDAASVHLNAADYNRVFVCNLENEMTLERLWSIHNAPDRPCGKSMRSLSMSDIVVLRRDGKSQAFYVDSFDYKEVPQFLEQLQQQQEKTPNKSLEQILTEARSVAGRANDAGQTKAPRQHAAGEVHGKFDT